MTESILGLLIQTMSAMVVINTTLLKLHAIGSEEDDALLNLHAIDSEEDELLGELALGSKGEGPCAGGEDLACSLSALMSACPSGLQP